MMEIKKIDHNFSVCQVEDYSLVYWKDGRREVSCMYHR